MSLLALAILSLALLASAPAASADLIVGSPGSGAGQYETPAGVAVDTETGHVYVADAEDRRVDVFDETGAFLFAFGWKVNATSPEEKLQTCTAVSGCQIGSAGSGAGQFARGDGSEPVAVDNSSHAVYVTDGENNRIEKFDSEGHFLSMLGGGVNTGTSGNHNLCTNAGAPTDVCGAGSAGGGAGQFADISGLAVGPAETLYVADSPHIGLFDSEGFNNRVEEFDSTGVFIKQIGPLAPTGAGNSRLRGLAVDSSGDLYVASEASSGGVRKYSPAGIPVVGWGEEGEVDPSFNVSAVTLDPAGDIFVTDNTGGSRQVLEYDPSGAQTLVFFGGGTLEGPANSLAFYHDATGDLFAVEDRFGEPGARVVQVALPEPGPLLVPGSTSASRVSSVKATLGVTFNPENEATHAHFQYIAKDEFEADGDSFGVGTLETPESPNSEAVFVNESVEATNVCVVPTEATCLEPNTTYYFRAIAENTAGTVTGEKAQFTTTSSVEVRASWASDVGTDSARLHAEVNPLGVAATAYFQYIAEGADYRAHGFEHAISVPSPAGPLNFGDGEDPVAAATQLYPLEPGTIYHYRLVASDPYFLPVLSAEHVFTTFAQLGATGAQECLVNEAFRTGPSAALPDCRAYEMVTPLDKDNGDVLARINNDSYPTNLDQSSMVGSGFTYSSYRAFAKPQSAPYTNQYLAARHERGEATEGWSSQAIDPPRGPQFRFEAENEYFAFSSELEDAWLLQEGEPTLGSPCAPAGFADVYRRQSSNGAYQALSCVKPTTVPSVEYRPELQGFSADGSHALIRIDNKLTPNASSAITEGRPVYQLYESSGAGALHLVSALPNGEASNSDSSAGTIFGEGLQNHNRFNSVLHAISEDGSRVFWSTGTGSGPIYLRLNADQPQSKLAAGKCAQPTRGCTLAVSETITPEPAVFQVANPQATRALFTVAKGALAGNLYEFDSQAEPTRSNLIASGVMESILGASEDLSHIYFASEEASPGEQAEGAIQGRPNLYLAKEGTTHFIATLSTTEEPSDVRNPYGSPIATRPIEHTARVSSDGTSLVFMSNSLTLGERTAGYDNTDADSGQPDDEVYLYDANANGGAGRLRCISCNPTGARPVGRELQLRVAIKGKVNPWGAARIPLFESQLYQSRYLSEDGKRAFFDSYDGLVVGDTNDKEDVYEWEAVGAGNCTAESASYVVGSEGCLSLISSGRSPDDSEFLDASSTGSDAFFTTTEGLLPKDTGLIDVYDARIDGGFPPPPTPPAACEGEACQGAPAPPFDATPASFAFTGPGNHTPSLATPKTKAKPAVKPCKKDAVRKKGKCIKKPAKKGPVSKQRTNRSARRTVKRNRRSPR